MKEFNANDTVSFQGDLQNEALEATTVAYVNNAQKQAVIEHPDGHLGSEFGNLPGLEEQKTYIYCKTDHLELVSAAETIETVVGEPVDNAAAGSAPVADKPTIKPLSEVLSFLAEKRPDDAALLNKYSADAKKHEDKAAKKAADEAAKATEAERKRQAEEKAREEQEMAEAVAGDAAERLAEQKRQREQINDVIEKGLEVGVLEIREAAGGEGFYLNGLPFFRETDREAFANYLQNTPDEMVNLSQAIAIGKPATEEAPAEEAPTAPAADNPPAAEEAPAAPPADNPPAAEEAPAAPPAADNGPTYKEKLLSIKGIGPKVADDIITVFPTQEDLLQGIKDKKLAFSKNVDAALKKASKTKLFKG